MIYYFSGTGNSRFAATILANLLRLDKAFIPDTNPLEISLPTERILFVFPVYSWGVPPLVIEFIKKIPSSFWEEAKSGNYPIDCVMTCGDEVALAPEMLIKVFKKQGGSLQSVWSVIMPNNYVLLPGFDVDPKKLEDRKLQECQGRLMEIAQSLERGDRRIDVTRGKWPWLKTKLIYPLFKKWGIFPKQWHYRDNCINCGKCASICPILNVEMKNGHPSWGARCCSCLGCYHVCPVHAVEYGKETKKKGQYLFPLRKI